MSDAFEKLRLEFLAETEDTLGELQRDLNALGSSAEAEPAGNPALVDRVFRTTHSLKGVAGMFGLDEMSAVSHALENVFDQIRDGHLALEPELIDLLYQGNESLHRLLGFASGRSEGDSQTEAEAVIDRIDCYLQEHAPESEGMGGDRNALATAYESLANDEKDDVLRAIEEGKKIVLVRARFPDEGFEDPFRELLEAIRGWGTVHGTIPGARDEEAQTFEICLVASGPDDLFALIKVAAPLGADVVPCDPRAVLQSTRSEAPEASTETDKEAEAHTQEVAEGVETPDSSGPAEEATEPPDESATTVDESSPEATDDASAKADSESSSTSRPARSVTSGGTLRVAVDRIDRVLSELAEVMQARMGLESNAEGLLSSSSNRMQNTLFVQSLRNLDRRIRGLHQEILGMRMVTLTSQFQKLERIVREACRVTGKEARFATSEEGVELDKRIVDALTDPLVHLVRNAVDHGLEDPEYRVSKGKDPIGTVEIRSYPEGSHTILEVSDDGSGMDLDAIRAKAVRLGLIDEAAELPRSDLLEVIFQPGFTVRDVATQISGRGVGLDAVRDAILAVGGIIEVDTGPNGTRFRLRIPTTLAIAQALDVRSGGETFFVPLSSVVEVTQVSMSALENIGGELVLPREDRLIPVRNLSELLRLGEAAAPKGERRPAVVLGLAEKRLILMVDVLGAQREIVVRSLGTLLPPIPGISGSTELGDGRTVLILDPLSLMELSGNAPEFLRSEL